MSFYEQPGHQSALNAQTSLTEANSDYTADMGKDRFDHCRAKNLIYQSHDGRPGTPQKTGKKGPPGGLAPHLAPYATIDEARHPAGSSTKMLGRTTSSGAPWASNVTEETANNQKAGFDPAVYAANRAANMKIKEESARRSFVGNGAILSHPVADTAFPKP